MTILVANFTYNFLATIVTLVSNVTNVPMVTFSAVYQGYSCSLVTTDTQRREE